jgi:glycosyltransferase involved in cell wall biosynthesis
MKVSVIAGSFPPQVCGVGDFTAGLIKALQARGVSITLKHRDRWHLQDVATLLRDLKAEGADVVHFQYPAHGFRRSLVPHLLYLGLTGWPRLTTLHDYSGQRWPVRMGMSIFTLGGHLIATGALDRDALARRYPWTANRLHVIPIASNIPGGRWEPSGTFTIVHFGMLRPQKGIEEMIHLARLCHQSGRPYRTIIMGAIVPHIHKYAETLFKMAENAGIEWHIGVSPERASDILRHAHVAYLSPPCGVHERRGTLLACAANGLPVIAKVNWETPAFLRDYVVPVASTSEALSAVDELIEPDRLRAQSNRSRALAKMFSWETIADRYIEAMKIAASPGKGPGWRARTYGRAPGHYSDTAAASATGRELELK